MKKKDVLLLGGTSFVGRNLAEYLIAQEALNVTLFNRGVSNPNLFSETNQISGDRNNEKDVEQVFNTAWDYIIDVSCYYPHQLRNVLNGDLKHLKNYIFISTCSVYDNSAYQGKLRDETAPILPCTPEQEVDTEPQTYGQRKAQCERILVDSGKPYSILRPALIYGQYDPTDRLYYWLYQTRMKNEVLLPEGGLRNFSMTYIQDLVRSISQIIEADVTNEVFNCISHPSTSIADIVDVCEKQYGHSVTKLSATAAFLIQHEVQQWSGIPLWLNTDDFTYSNRKMVETLSVQTTALKDGIEETANYFNGIGYAQPKFGIDESEKNRLIALLKNELNQT